MRAAAQDLRAKGAALVLVKGGHLAGANGRAAVDVACDGNGLEELESEVVRCKPVFLEPQSLESSQKENR